MPAAHFNRLKTLLGFAYPFVAHVAIVRNSIALVVVALGLLVAVALLPALLRGSVAAWLSIPIIGAGLWGLSRSTHAALPLYIAPVLVPGFMACVFGASLAAGQTPLIERVIQLMHGPGEEAPEEAVWAYARRLTLAWTVLFVALATTNLILALLASPDGLLLAGGVVPPLTVPQEWWSLFANLLGYLLVAAFFVIEYAYRRHRFPRQPYRNMLDFFRRLLLAMPRLIQESAGQALNQNRAERS